MFEPFWELLRNQKTVPRRCSEAEAILRRTVDLWGGVVPKLGVPFKWVQRGYIGFRVWEFPKIMGTSRNRGSIGVISRDNGKANGSYYFGFRA